MRDCWHLTISRSFVVLRKHPKLFFYPRAILEVKVSFPRSSDRITVEQSFENYALDTRARGFNPEWGGFPHGRA